MVRRNSLGEDVSELLRDDQPWRYYSGLSEKQQQLLGFEEHQTWMSQSARKRWLTKQKGRLLKGKSKGTDQEKKELLDQLDMLLGRDAGERSWHYIRYPVGNGDDWHDIKSAPCVSNNWHHLFK